MASKEFDNWFHEIEAFSLRSERFYYTLQMLEESENLTYKSRIIRGWLEAAFQAGEESILEKYQDEDGILDD